MAKPSRTRPLKQIPAVGVPLIVLYAGGQLGVPALAKLMPPTLQAPVEIVGRLLMCALLLVGYRAGMHWLRKDDVPELATARLGRHLGGGIALGVGLFAITEAVLFALGYAHYTGLGSLGPPSVVLAGSTMAAIGEELIFRGVVFRTVEQAFGTTIALVLSSALFGGLHLLNPQANLIGVAAIALEAGVLLGLAYARTRTMWLAIGIHLGWNFTEGGVFGSIVSGNGGHSIGLINVTLDGSALWTGGAFGPEASLAAVVACVTASVILAISTRRAGEWQPARDAS